MANMMPSDSPLQLYGPTLEVYRGAGKLTLESKRKVACEFAAGQLESGKTVLLCATPDPLWEHRIADVTVDRFEGATEDGCTLEVNHIVSQTRYLPAAVEPGSYLAMRVGHLKVCRHPIRTRRRLRFLLANLRGVHAGVSFAYRGLALTLSPTSDSARNLERLEVMRGVLPTAYLDVSTRGSVERATEAVDEFCYLMSIALGMKVQWIALTEATASEAWTIKHHYSRVTKRYGALSVINPHTTEIADFIRSCDDGGLRAGRHPVGLTDAAIDTYLDAKSEGDFLQVRGLKLVVAVEMLKSGNSEKTGAAALVFPSDTFAPMVRTLRKVVKGAFPFGSTPDQRDAIYANIAGLNRTPFLSQLRALCDAVSMSVGADEVRRFVASRNKLVHEGRFYCERATEKERSRLAPLDSPQSEWFWLLHFVDRLFLRAIAYEGEYIDWSKRGQPMPRQLRGA